MNDGGPVFARAAYYPSDPADRLEPRERMELSNEAQSGISLRDWFAGRAPAYPFMLPEVARGSAGTYGLVANIIAEWNYVYADAMLRARDKETR